MTPAITAASRAGIDHEVLEYAHDPQAASFGLEAAEALHLPPEQVFKTLVAATASGRLAVAIVPVAARLDLKALAGALGEKRAGMADPRDAERATGYVVGGISPLGQRRRLATVLDASAMTHDRIYVSAGRRGLEISLRPSALADLCGARMASISR